MKIALVSLNQAWENKKLNRVYCEKYVQNAAHCSCEMAIFPEMTLTGFSMDSGNISEPYSNSESIIFFSQLAKKFNLYIVFGVVLNNNPLPLNCAVIIAPDGTILANYAKIHPFSFANEELHYSNGTSISYSKINDEVFGLTICYDLRFPEIFQAISQHAGVIINIANWPESRIAHWYALIKARAIENLSFVIGVNRTRTDGKGVHYIRSSTIVNPNGDELQPIHSLEDMDVFDINLKQIEEYRKTYPFKRDRKVTLYKSIL